MSECSAEDRSTLSKGAVRMLRTVLPTPHWYKDDHKQGLMIIRSASAYDKLPDDDAPQSDEDIDSWASAKVSFQSFSKKEMDAVKKCFNHYLSQGAFAANKYCCELIRFLDLAEED